MRTAWVIASIGAALLALSAGADAGYYTCGGGARYVNGRCSDGSMAAYHADLIAPDRSQPTAHDRNDREPTYGRNKHWNDRRYDGGSDRSDNDRGNGHSGQGGEELFGAWSTNVAGAVWTSPSDIPGWSTLHVSPGALAGMLVIYPDGRYVWNSYGGKRGRWHYSDVPGYPIQLIDNSEKKLWNVGIDDRHPGHIYINESHGYYYYTGRRP